MLPACSFDSEEVKGFVISIVTHILVTGEALCCGRHPTEYVIAYHLIPPETYGKVRLRLCQELVHQEGISRWHGWTSPGLFDTKVKARGFCSALPVN